MIFFFSCEKITKFNVISLKLPIYSNTDFASNHDRIYIGSVIMLIDQVPVEWRTFKHKCVSLSSMEREFTSTTEAGKELIWISHVIEE